MRFVEANGAEIPVDASGSIELSEEEAAPLKLGQVRRLDEPKA